MMLILEFNECGNNSFLELRDFKRLLKLVRFGRRIRFLWFVEKTVLEFKVAVLGLWRDIRDADETDREHGDVHAASRNAQRIVHETTGAAATQRQRFLHHVAVASS